METSKTLLIFPKKTTVKNPAAVALGKLGGKKGGVARAQALTIDERNSIGFENTQVFRFRC